MELYSENQVLIFIFFELRNKLRTVLRGRHDDAVVERIANIEYGACRNVVVGRGDVHWISELECTTPFASKLSNPATYARVRK